MLCTNIMVTRGRTGSCVDICLISPLIPINNSNACELPIVRERMYDALDVQLNTNGSRGRLALSVSQMNVAAMARVRSQLQTMSSSLYNVEIYDYTTCGCYTIN